MKAETVKMRPKDSRKTVKITAMIDLVYAISLLNSRNEYEARLGRITYLEAQIMILLRLIDESASIGDLIDAVSTDNDSMVDAVLAICILINEGALRVDDPLNVTRGSIVEIAKGGY